MTLAVIDMDSIIYSAGFANEDRSLKVTHNLSGKTQIFKNKTEFWGNKRKEIGGWLGELNNKRALEGKKEFTKEDFSVEEIQTTGPVENTIHTVKQMVNRFCDSVKAKEYVGYIGVGDSWRVERSTIMKYKGNREDALRPLLKDEITEYLVKYHNGVKVMGLEADDWVNITAYKNKGVGITYDKDILGCPVLSYNPNLPELGIQNGNCFGEIYKTFKQKPDGSETVDDIKGIGRMFLYFQLLNGDVVDNYKPSYASDSKFGKMSAYDALSGAKTDLEALEAIRDTYRTLYPTRKEIIGWRGDTIVIDWLYVLNEMWDLARMKRWEGDNISAEDVLKKFKLI